MNATSLQSISTHVIPASNTKPKRIVAKHTGGGKIIISYPMEDMRPEAAHFVAARALAKRLDWSGRMVSGGTPDGYVFCFVDSAQFTI